MYWDNVEEINMFRLNVKTYVRVLKDELSDRAENKQQEENMKLLYGLLKKW